MPFCLSKKANKKDPAIDCQPDGGWFLDLALKHTVNLKSIWFFVCWRFAYHSTTLVQCLLLIPFACQHNEQKAKPMKVCAPACFLEWWPKGNALSELDFLRPFWSSKKDKGHRRPRSRKLLQVLFTIFVDVGTINNYLIEFRQTDIHWQHRLLNNLCQISLAKKSNLIQRSLSHFFD